MLFMLDIFTKLEPFHLFRLNYFDVMLQRKYKNGKIKKRKIISAKQPLEWVKLYIIIVLRHFLNIFCRHLVDCTAEYFFCIIGFRRNLDQTNMFWNYPFARYWIPVFLSGFILFGIYSNTVSRMCFITT